MVDHDLAVGGEVNVKLDPVGAKLPGGEEGRDGVLPGQLSRSTVGEDLGHSTLPPRVWPPWQERSQRR